MEADIKHNPPSELIKEIETLKLIKNSRGFGWEIKIFNEGDTDKWLARLEKINDTMLEKFGSLDND
tara:strand:- start:74 stop:271 length:198 start_codon:yes stop_codon:yes gene_type:complete